MLQNSDVEREKHILINRTFNLPLETVWKAWTDPEYCKKWWGPKDFTCPSCIINFQVGGKYLSCMKSSSDGKEYWSTGEYLEIIPKKKIVMSDNFSDSQGNIVDPSEYGMPGDWGEHLTITLEFEDVDGKTKMSLEHVGIPEDMKDDCITGWQESFDKMEDVLS